MNNEEQKVLSALKEVQEYCKEVSCGECIFGRKKADIRGSVCGLGTNPQRLIIKEKIIKVYEFVKQG